MYVPAAFRESRLDVVHAMIREHSFGTLVSEVNGELFATHLPFLLDDERGLKGTLVGHVARANPHWRSFSPDSASLAIFQGPHAYISPSWYASEQVVPTWNYTAVHAYGTPSVVEDPVRVRDILEQLVRTFESGRPVPWTTDGLGEAYIQKMLQAIVAFEMPIARLEGKRKLGQNRLAADVQGAVSGLRREGGPIENRLADVMLEALKQEASAAPPRG